MGFNSGFKGLKCNVKIKIKYVLRLTQLYNILLFFYYWLLVSASTDHHQANIYKKKLKNAGAYSIARQFYGIPFTFIISLYNC